MNKLFFFSIMANQLVQTTFQSGPDDKLAAIDIYSQTGGQGSINRIQTLTHEVSQIMGGGFGSELLGEATKAIKEAKAMSANAISGMTDALGQAISDKVRMASNAVSLISGTAEEMMVNKEELTNRILSASSEFSSSMRQMVGDVRDTMMGSIPLKSDLICTVNDVKRKISSTELKSVEAIGRLINDVSKTNLYRTQDNGALAGILGTVVGAASRIGIPDAFNEISKTITDSKLLIAVTKVALPQVVSASNMSTLRAISRSPVGKLVEAIAPGTVSKITKTFTMPLKVDRNARSDYELVNVISTIDNLKRGWNVKQRNGRSTAINLVDLLGGSSDFKNLLLNETRNLTTDNKSYGFAATLKPTSVRDSLRLDFPSVNISSLDKMRKTSVDITPPGLLEA